MLFPFGAYFQAFGASPFSVSSLSVATMTLTGTLTGTGSARIRMPNGTSAAPSIGFANDNAGMYLAAVSQLGFAGAGLNYGTWTSGLLSSVVNVTTPTGDFDAAGGFRRDLAPVSDTLAAGTTATLTRGNSASDDDGWFCMARAGSVVELAMWVDADRTASTAGVWVQKSTDGGDTWTDLWGTAGQTVCEINATDTERDVATVAKDTNSFAAGDLLRLRCVQAVGFAGPARIHAMLSVEH